MNIMKTKIKKLYTIPKWVFIIGYCYCVKIVLKGCLFFFRPKKKTKKLSFTPSSDFLHHVIFNEKIPGKDSTGEVERIKHLEGDQNTENNTLKQLEKSIMFGRFISAENSRLQYEIFGDIE